MRCSKCGTQFAAPSSRDATCGSCSQSELTTIPIEVKAAGLVVCILTTTCWSLFPPTWRATWHLYQAVELGRSGSAVGALPMIRAARSEFPESRLLVAHLAVAQVKSGNIEGAKETLNGLGDEPLPRDIHRVAFGAHYYIKALNAHSGSKTPPSVRR